MVEIKEVTTSKDLKKFVNFPNTLFKDNPYYVPVIVKNELDNFDTQKNPVYKHAWCKQYLAYKNGKIVGRIAVLYNENEIVLLKKNKMRFGWFDFIDDKEVSKALIDQALLLAREMGRDNLEGPMGFSNMDKAGMLTFGFENIASMIGLYNPAYYPKHMEALGFEKEKTYIEFLIDAPDTLDKILRFQKIIQEKYKVHVKNFQSKKELEPYLDELFGLVKDSYQQLATFVPLDDEELNYYKEKYMKILQLKFMNCVINEEGELVGFSIISPSFSKVLQKTKGKLFPLGWYQFMKAMKKNDHGEFILIGVKPEYQNKGITALLFAEVFKIIKELEIKTFETNPQLEENKSIQSLWKPYNPRTYKKRATFIKYLN